MCAKVSNTVGESIFSNVQYRLDIFTRSSATAEEPRDALRQLKYVAR